MIVVSLFDGISCSQLALDSLKLNIDKYYASEIDERATELVTLRYPSTIHLGDVTSINASTLSTVDLLIGGSPCQDLSVISHNRKGLSGTKSQLFWQYIRVLHDLKPKYFVFENVASMGKADKDIISKAFGFEPIKINSKLLTGQLRSRYYWTNIPNVKQPIDIGITFSSCLEHGFTEREKSLCCTTSPGRPSLTILRRYLKMHYNQIVYSSYERMKYFSNSPWDADFSEWSNCNDDRYGMYGTRGLTLLEYERLQGLPEGYTSGFGKTLRYRWIGNGFTIPVIAHILSFMI